MWTEVPRHIFHCGTNAPAPASEAMIIFHSSLQKKNLHFFLPVTNTTGKKKEENILWLYTAKTFEWPHAQGCVLLYGSMVHGLWFVCASLAFALVFPSCCTPFPAISCWRTNGWSVFIWKRVGFVWVLLEIAISLYDTSQAMFRTDFLFRLHYV